MKRVWIFLVLFGIIVAASAAVGQATPALRLNKRAISAKQCQPEGSDAVQLVNVRYTLINDYDSGFGGNAWANDTIRRNLRIWQLNDGTFCVRVSDHGHFVTFAGTSPSGFSTVSAGIKGKMYGGYVSTFFTGTFNPTLPTSGYLGTFDLQCDPSFNCPGAHPSYLSYISGDSGFDLPHWGWIYHALRGHETWLNQDNVPAAASGDITG